MSKKTNRKGRRAKKPDKHAKLKLAAIPVLLLLLVYVVYDAVAGDASDDPVAVLNPAQQSNSAGNTVAKQTEQGRLWDEPTLSLLLMQNPFEDYTAQELDDLSASRLVALGETGQSSSGAGTQQSTTVATGGFDVPYVFESARKSKALIDGKVVHLGEEVSEGLSLQTIVNGKMVLHRRSKAETNSPKRQIQ